MKTVVFLDLDGTLWTHGAVPGSARAAIRAAQGRGHMFLANTGRARSEVAGLSSLDLDGYCFAAGANVVVGGRTIVDRPLGAELTRAVMGALDAHRMNYNLEGGESSWIRVNDEAAFESAFAEFEGTPDPVTELSRIEEMPPAALGDVYKVTYHGGPAGFDELAAAMPRGISLTYLGPGKAEATRAGVTKATAMEAVRSCLGEGWRTMAVGDSDNDLPMLAAADVSACMGNGNDRAKAAATWVTSAIDDDGLARALAHFGLIDGVPRVG